MRQGQLFEYEDRVFRFDSYEQEGGFRLLVAHCITPQVEDEGETLWALDAELVEPTPVYTVH